MVAAGERSRTSTWFVRAAVAIAFAPAAYAVTFGAWHDRGYTVDDSFISWRFARNLAEGHGLAWNPGGDRCEGYTNFLYVVLVAAGVRLGAAAPMAGLAIGIASALALVALAWRTCRATRWASIASAAVAIAWWWRPEPRIHAGRGLETALFGLLVAALLLLADRKRLFGETAGRRWLALAATALALVLCRPDGLLLVAGLWIALLLAERVAIGAWLARSRGATAFLVGSIGSYALWKWSYFGDLLPNSYYAKAVMPGWPGLDDTRRFVEEHAFALGLGGAVLLLHVAARLVVPIARGRPWREVARGELRPALALALAAAWLVYSCRIVHEMGFHHRFLQPVVVLVLFGSFHALRDLGRAWHASAAMPALAIVAWFVAAVACGRPMIDELRQTRAPETVDPFVAMFERLGRGIGEAARGRPLTLVCTHAGATPYYADVVHVDPGGLVDDGFSSRRSRREREEYRAALRPDVVCWHFFPASEGATSLDGDARATASSYVRWCLAGDPSVDALARWDAENRAAGARRREMFELMAWFRDECTLVGEMAVGVKRWREFVYVAKASPRHDELVAELARLVDVPGDAIDWDGWPQR